MTKAAGTNVPGVIARRLRELAMTSRIDTTAVATDHRGQRGDVQMREVECVAGRLAGDELGADGARADHRGKYSRIERAGLGKMPSKLSCPR